MVLAAGPGAELQKADGAPEARGTMLFQDRSDAGRQLASKVREYANLPDVLVLALPRGGVPVAFEVAQELDAPLDVYLVRKLGLPGHPELAMGAIASGGVRVLNEDVVQGLLVPGELIDEIASQEEEELKRREQLYRDGRPALEVRGRTILLIDDGLATGSTMRAAVAALRQLKPTRIIVAVPVAAEETCGALCDEVDAIACVQTPHPFYAVGVWYENFAQTTDDEVRALLARAAGEHGSNGV
jgi:predicted phosphoribosyltransferase